MIHTIVIHSVRSPRVGFAGRCNPFLAIMVVLAVILLPTVPVLGQEEEEGDPVAAAQDREEAASVAVVIDGVELFRLRGTPDYPAGTRAREVAGRIIAIGRDRAIDIATIRVEPSDLGPRLTGFFRDRDLLLRAMGNTVYMMPPYCIEGDDLDHIYTAIGEAADQCVAG